MDGTALTDTVWGWTTSASPCCASEGAVSADAEAEPGDPHRCRSDRHPCRDKRAVKVAALAHTHQ